MNNNKEALLPASVLKGQRYSYTIKRLLGQGSFGITYLAATTVQMDGGLGQIESEVPVAIKEFFMRDINSRSGSSISQGTMSRMFEKYREKFAREAQNLSRLQHPGWHGMKATAWVPPAPWAAKHLTSWDCTT